MCSKETKQVILFTSLMLCVSYGGSAAALVWSDILDSNGGAKVSWGNKNESQKAEHLELYVQSIKYCQQNIGKRITEVNSEISGPRVSIFYAITYETISMLYREYGDLRKSAEYMRMFWEEFNKNPKSAPILNADGNPTGYVMSAYRDAGMYTELLEFYPKAYKEKIERLALISNTNLLKDNFSAYSKRWPKEAKEYERFMQKWKESKRLAKNKKPLQLDIAVQNHEWFYSEKQEEVLKALRYYRDNKVRFMLENALAHKDSVVSAKAKEYLRNLE